MAYSSLTDLTEAVDSNLVRELTDDLNTGSTDAAKVNRAIADADAVINGHIRAHYSVPLEAPIPALVRKVSVDLALFNLFSRRGAIFEMPSWITARHDDAMKMLVGMRDGKIDLGVEPPPSASSAVVAVAGGSEVLFTSDTLEEF